MHPPNDLAPFLAWFDGYCRTFSSADPEDQRNLDLKEIHTHKVLEGIQLIAAGTGERRQFLAGVAALCHDLGRFPQYQRYRTFKDADSVNHAHLSVQVVSEQGLLKGLDEEEADDILTAVRWHNAFSIPEGLSPGGCDLLRLLRDADKLDIWRVFIDYYRAPEGEKASAAGLGLPDLPQVSPEAAASFAAGEIVRLNTLKSINDFKLLQLSWLYDINFAGTLALVRQRGIIEALVETLPREETIGVALERLNRHLEERLAGREEI